MIDRTRLSDRISVKRVVLDTKRSVGSAITLAIGVAILIACAAWLVSQVSQTLFRSTYTAHFAVKDATDVVAGVDQVRYRGIVAGTISKVKRESDGQVILTATLKKKYGPIYKDAQAELRPGTPLQDMYLDVTDPGHPSAGKLPSSAVLPSSRTIDSVNIDDVLDTLGGDERFHLRELLANLGGGLADNGANLKAIFVQLAPTIQYAGEISHAISLRNTDTAKLVHNIGVLTNTLGQRQDTLKTLLAEGSATFGALGQSSGNLGATLSQLPPTFSSLTTTLNTVQGILRPLDNAFGHLDPVADSLSGGLSSLRSLNSELAPAVTKLQRPVKQLVPFVKTLPQLAQPLSKASTALKPQVPVIDRTTNDLARCRTGVIGFFQWDASLLKFGDDRGVVPRGYVTINAPDISNNPTEAKRSPGPNCVVGAPTIGGRPDEAGDYH